MTFYLVLVGGVLLAVLGVWAIVHKIRFQYLVRADRRRTLEAWTEMARARGFEVVTRDGRPVMRGTVASRSFEIDYPNFFTYGMDAETALHFRVEDEEASFSIAGWEFVDPPRHLARHFVGVERFDAHHGMRTNEAGKRWVARFGPKERQLLLDHNGLDVLQRSGEVSIRLPYTITPSDLDAACQLVASVWGVPASVENDA
jgi:hypothetical protein